MRRGWISCGFAGVLAAAGCRLAGADVPRWQPRDFSFHAAVAPANPFRVSFAATASGPEGTRLEVPGFFDGDGTWKIRFAPTLPGPWTLVTRSDLPALDGQRAELACSAADPGNHGAWRIDPQRPHQFVCEDGIRVLPMGYECDWLWALDWGNDALPTVNRLLATVRAQGFDFVILNTYAYDTSWRRGRTGPDDYGPPPGYPWAGSNDAPDQSKFDLAYWRHFDRVMDALLRHGLGAHLFLRVYNKKVRWPANGSADDDRYYWWVIARYAAYPNVIWDLAKEAQYEKDVGYKLSRLRLIRELDPYRRLLTVHDDRALYDAGRYDALLDFRTDQQHERWRDVMRAHLAQHAWPVLNSEFGYEQGPGGAHDKTYNVAQSAEEVARRAWEIYLAGGSGAYYYTYTAWDVIRPGDHPPGYAYFHHLREFFERTAYWRLQPLDDVASAGSCAGDPGCEYVVFLPKPTALSLCVEQAAAPLPVEWFRPWTGERQPAGFAGNGVATFQPPPGWGSGPVVLHVGQGRP